MKSIRISVNLPVLALMIFLVGVIAYQAAGRRPARADPTVVVSVNRKVVLDGMKETAQVLAELNAVKDGYDNEVKQYEEELTVLRGQLETAVGPEKLRLQRNIEERVMDARGFVQYRDMKLDVELSLLYEKLYRSISDAIEQMAITEGYDIVIEDDSKSPFVINPEIRVSRVNQIQRQISERRIMYANPTVDITEALIIRMNNAFDAG